MSCQHGNWPPCELCDAEDALYAKISMLQDELDAACPHCGKPRATPPAQQEQTMDQETHTTPPIAWVSDAIRDVATERRRQIESEGYDPTHDDEHVNEEIAAMAAYYAMPEGARAWDATSTGYGETLGEAMVPLHWYMPSPCDRRRELVKAGALILAEIERLDRMTATPAAGTTTSKGGAT